MFPVVSKESMLQELLWAYREKMFILFKKI